LGDNGTNLSSCGRCTAGCGPISSGKTFASDDKCGCVWPEVEEELSNYVKAKETMTGKPEKTNISIFAKERQQMNREVLTCDMQSLLRFEKSVVVC